MSAVGSIDLSINLKVLLYDTDFYALQSLNGYLAWDRRTRVTCLAETLEQVWDYIKRTPTAELPDIVVLDADHLGGRDALKVLLEQLRTRIPHVRIVCMCQRIDAALVEIAADTAANAYLLKQETRFQIAWAIIYTLTFDFVITQSIARACHKIFNTRIFHAKILPGQREYPELTGRIRQALRLCVVEGMPAHLAADEMGISLHTIRGYIKEGYRILESYDETEYPVDMTPQERAFMRLTAFADEEQEQTGS